MQKLVFKHSLDLIRPDVFDLAVSAVMKSNDPRRLLNLLLNLRDRNYTAYGPSDLASAKKLYIVYLISGGKCSLEEVWREESVLAMVYRECCMLLDGYRVYNNSRLDNVEARLIYEYRKSDIEEGVVEVEYDESLLTRKSVEGNNMIFYVLVDCIYKTYIHRFMMPKYSTEDLKRLHGEVASCLDTMPISVVITLGEFIGGTLSKEEAYNLRKQIAKTKLIHCVPKTISTNSSKKKTRVSKSRKK